MSANVIMCFQVKKSTNIDRISIPEFYSNQDCIGGNKNKDTEPIGDIAKRINLSKLIKITFKDLQPYLITARQSSSMPKHPSNTKSSRYLSLNMDGKHFSVI